jgi:hypothetical protein
MYELLKGQIIRYQDFYTENTNETKKIRKTTISFIRVLTVMSACTGKDMRGRKFIIALLNQKENQKKKIIMSWPN